MNYRKLYVLEAAAGTKETGPEFPQAQDTTSLCFASVKKARRPNWTEYEEDLIFDYFIMDKRAKSTDFVSSAALGSTGLIVSTTLRNLLQDFILPYHRFYPTRLCRPNQKECYDTYFVLLTKSIGLEYLDFSRMTFVYAPSESEREVVPVTTKNEYLTTYENYPVGSFNRQGDIYLKPDLHTVPDLFRIERFYVFPIISPALKATLEREKITGIEIVDATKVRIPSCGQDA